MTKPTLMDAHRAAVEARHAQYLGKIRFTEYDAIESTFAALCAEQEAEMERLRAEVADIDVVALRADNAQLEANNAALRARVADVLRPFADDADETGIVPDEWPVGKAGSLREKHLRAAAALLKELEP